MKTKLIKGRRLFLFLGLFLILGTLPTKAEVNYLFQTLYPVLDYEQGSSLLTLTLAIDGRGVDVPPIRIGGITMNIDNFDTSVFSNPIPVDLFTTMQNGDLWQTNPGPGAVVLPGGIIQYTKAAVGTTPLASGLGRTLRETTSLYRLPFSIREDAPAAPGGTPTTLSFEPTNNRAQNESFVNYTLNQPAATYNIILAQPPQGFSFSAPAASVADLETGNGVQVNWTALSNVIGAADLTPPITYDIYRYTTSGAALDDATNRIASSRDGGYALGAVGGAASFTDSGLSDGITYYYKMRAKDSASSNDELGRHRTTYTDGQERSVTPHDFDPPLAVTGVTVTETRDRQVSLSWNASSPDTGGYIVIRRAGSPVTILDADNSLGRASGTQDGPDPAATYARGTTYNGGIVVAHRVGRSTTTFTDVLGGGDDAALALVNGTQYFYTVVAYDRVRSEIASPFQPREQGFNYSDVGAGSVDSGTPGVAPAPVTNFSAVPGGPGEITLAWNNSASDFFQGVLIRYVTIANPSDADQMATWDAMDDRDGAGDLTLVTGTDLIDWARPPAGDPQEPTEARVSITLSADAARTLFTEGTTYYFMAFAHNGSGRHAAGEKASSSPGITPGVGSVSNLRIQVNESTGHTTLNFDTAGLPADREIEVLASATAGGAFDPITTPPLPVEADDPHDDTDEDGVFEGSFTIEDGAVLERYYKVRISGGGPWSPETVGKIQISLNTGINSVAIPFVTNVSRNSPTFDMNADGLRSAADGGSPAVTYVAGWNAAQSEFARLYSLADGSITDVGGAGNFAIEPEIGYQVNVNIPAGQTRPWWVVGQR